MNLLIHKGKKAKDLFFKDGTIPDPIFTENSELNIVQTIINQQLEIGETDKWNKMANTCMVLSENTSTGVHHMDTTDKICTKHQKTERTRAEAMCAK